MVDGKNRFESNGISEELRAAESDVIQIWKRGVDAVTPGTLISEYIRFENRTLVIGTPGTPGVRFDGDRLGRILVVGGGKAGASMAEAVERRFLHPEMVASRSMGIPIATGTSIDEESNVAADTQNDATDGSDTGSDAANFSAITGVEPEFWRQKFVGGWVNVPDDCVRSLERITLCGARPPMVNEPTEAGVVGTQQMLRLISELTADDLCICLISGGGSALMPAPIDGVTLQDVVTLTRFLSDAGANITQINLVRRQLSLVKGGRMAQACTASMVALILSDVPGDPLDLIASGPTVLGGGTAADALAVLYQYHADAPESGIRRGVLRILEERAKRERATGETRRAAEECSGTVVLPPRVFNMVIANNAMAVSSASWIAYRMGYEVVEANAALRPEGFVEDVARALVDQMVSHLGLAGMDILAMESDRMVTISGGEPVVRLVRPEIRGVGGRNTQLVLAALLYLEALYEGRVSANLSGAVENREKLGRITILSGGTDGEDGPTDAAGAIGTLETIRRARADGVDPEDFLARNDAWSFFDLVGGLIRTGPTHTNVCDLRVILYR